MQYEVTALYANGSKTRATRSSTKPVSSGPLDTKNINPLPLRRQTARQNDYAYRSRLHYESAQLSRIQYENAQEMNIAVFPGPHGNPSCYCRGVTQGASKDIGRACNDQFGCGQTPRQHTFALGPHGRKEWLQDYV
jgi:hypothetical protein